MMRALARQMGALAVLLTVSACTAAATPRPPTSDSGAGTSPPVWHEVARAAVPGFGQMVFAGGSLWVVEHDGPRPYGAGQLWRLDPRTLAVKAVYPDIEGKWPVAGHGAIWLADDFGTPRVVTRWDIATATPTTITTGRSPSSIPRSLAITPDGVIVGDGDEHTATRLTPDGRLAGRHTLKWTGAIAGWAATIGDSIFLPAAIDGAVIRIDRTTGRQLSTIDLTDPFSIALTAAGGRLYVGGRDSVSEIDVSTVGAERVLRRVRLTPDTPEPTEEPHPGGDGTEPARLALVAGELWAPRRTPSEIIRLDPETLAIIGRIPFPDAPPEGNGIDHDVLTGDGLVWARVHDRVVRLSQGS